MGELNKQRNNQLACFVLLIFFCAFSIFMSPANAAIEKGLIKSTFISKPTDAYSFVKQQLRYQGFREAITKELKAMNLDSDLFWSRYEEKFQETFLPTEEKLKQTYGMDAEKVKLSKKLKYEKELRRAKLSRISRFGNLAKVISRFSVKKISRSTKNPNKRYMRMKVKVNRRVLQKVYMQFVSSQSTVQYDRLIIHPRLVLEGGAWTDLGVSSKNVLEGALYDHWQNWFVTNYSDLANLIELEKMNGPSIVIQVKQKEEATEENKEEVKEGEQTAEAGASEPTGEAPQAGQGETPSQIVDSAESENKEGSLRQLHVFIEVNVKKTFEDELENYRGFSFKIFTNVIDGQSAQLVTSKDLSAEPQSFSTINIKELSSNVASAIYNLPLKDLERLKSEVLKYKASNGHIRVSVNHFPSDLITLKKRVEEIGLGIGVEADVVEYNQNKSMLAISYIPQDEKFTSFIARMNEIEFIKSKGATVEFSPEENVIDVFVANQKEELQESNQLELSKQEKELLQNVTMPQDTPNTENGSKVSE
jgi:hypothetical protein